MTLRREMDRIKEDFERGGKLGEKSTRRLIALVDVLVREVEELRRFRLSQLAGHPGYD